MRVYLIQHGEAKAKEDDPERPLTDKGAADVRRVAAFVEPLHLRVRAIWQSGKTRARQTAETFAAVVKAGEGVVKAGEGVVRRAGMGPKDDVVPVAEEIVRGGEDLVLVGHLPFLGKLAGRLLVGDESQQPVAFQYGGVVCLEQAAGGAWQVRWMLTPEALGGI